MRWTAYPRSTLATTLRYLLSLALLAWVATRIRGTDLGGLRALDWRLAIGAALLAGLAYPVQAFRWHVLLRAQGLHLPARRVHRAFWIGQFYNSFLPGGVAGDVVRFAHVWRDHPDQKAAVAAGLVADRLLGLGTLFALTALALGVHVAGGGPLAGLESLLAGSLAAFALLFAVTWIVTRTRWPEKLMTRLAGPARSAALHEAAGALGREHRALAIGLGLSVVVWLLDFAAVWVLAQAVGLYAGPVAVAVAASGAYVAAALPISIGGHGVRESALVALLGLMGHPAGPGSAVPALALAFWVISVGWSLPGGIAALLPAGQK